MDGSARRLLERIKEPTVYIHRSILDYLFHEAKKGITRAITGIGELEKVYDIVVRNNNGGIIYYTEGYRPGSMISEEVTRSLTRNLAKEMDSILVTSDMMEASASRAMGVKVLYLGATERVELRISKYFDDKTMSVHLKEDAYPIAKKGRPGKWIFVVLERRKLKREELEDVSRELIEAAVASPKGFIEIDREGSSIIQLRDYRIVITRPPLSEGWEITAVRPLVKLRLEDYNLPEKLMSRLTERAEGILIAGAPGMGKTTFAQALAEFYMRMGRIVKTIESPRDMRLPPEITQYSKNYASLGELHDILLLSRPDYTVFDELRNDEDFKLYIDLRLAGIGMIGVIHATSPIDAIQRFMKRIELGMIPSIIDTVVYLNNGEVDKAYELKMTVKLPTGLREAELSRPVVEVRDFLTGDLEYEIYTFGEQTMVVPVRKQVRTDGTEKKMLHRISTILPDAEVEFRGSRILLKIPRTSTKALAKRIKRIKRMAEKYGYDVNVAIF
ncbi:MAG: Flp pilus assembly complex ATPase component TadA [Desulfurococcales archaeon]|nr:Flp pilus assembly complex ATPase component TadA [Desulfurococcales archaeon]